MRAHDVAPDLQSCRQLPVFGGEGLIGDDEAAHALDLRQAAVCTLDGVGDDLL